MLIKVGWDSDRQATGGVGHAKQNVANRMTSFASRIPGHDEAVNEVEPVRDLNGAAPFEHNDGFAGMAGG